jgi:hypothetical protein
VWYTRSTNGGLSFETERDFDAVLPAGERAGSRYPTVEIASDGGILISFWDEYDTDRVYVVRSVNGGDSFTNTHQQSLNNSNTAIRPSLNVSSVSSTLLLSWIGSTGALPVTRSSDDGATFGTIVSLVETALLYDVVRTKAGSWAVAWEDSRTEFLGEMTDVYVRVSIDDGINWGAEQRVDQDGAGTASSHFGVRSLTAVGSDGLLVAYFDSRDNNGKETNVYANRSPANPIDFSLNEQRVDEDTWQDNLLQYSSAAVAADGADHVYAAIMPVETGPWTDVWVAASADRGHTFPVMQRASADTPGASLELYPQLGAHPDGTVYLVFWRNQPDGNSLLALNRSDDFGATWRGTETIIAGPDPDIYDDFRLASLPDGRVYVVWTEGDNVFLSTSTDRGETFTAVDIDQDDPGWKRYPEMCVHGNQIAVVFRSPTEDNSRWSVWGTVSYDAGAAWSTATQLRPDPTSNSAAWPIVACDGVGGAVAFWSDFRSGSYYEAFANRFNGTSWDGEYKVGGPTPPDIHQYLPKPVFLSPSILTVVHNGGGEVWLSRSTDGGQTFLPQQRLDGNAPQPLASSWAPHLAGDTLGNLWVTWADESAGISSLAVCHSSDFGATFGPVYRANTELPQGSRVNNSDYFHRQSMAALPGVGLVVWNGNRSSSYWDSRFNAYEPNDLDRDGAAVSTDCDDFRSTVWTAPAEVDALRLEKLVGATRLSWDSQKLTAGTETTNDVVTGSLNSLLSSGDFSGATCLVFDRDDSPYDDTRPDPDPGQGDYYLVRAVNSCGTGSYGDSSLVPDPRDDLDTGTVCP